ncbi:Uncharacterized protein Adt_27185 [Abeliophyllum distichum]|uniref:Aminotransferase-like plant mobile domain-containing protein n=1 Tax=Abeliophyllum distichum TaxID=126358 RepID=A0ABD1RV27_9LAMI
MKEGDQLQFGRVPGGRAKQRGDVSLEGKRETSCSLAESQVGGTSSEMMLPWKKGDQLQFGRVPGLLRRVLLGVVERRRLLPFLRPWKLFCPSEALLRIRARWWPYPLRVDVVRWAALDVPSIMVAEDMNLLRDAYRIPSDIELLLPNPNERACFPMMGSPTQVSPNGWGQMVGGLYLWFRHSFGMEMPLHVFQTMYQPRQLPKKKGKDEEPGWYYFYPWGSHKPLVTESPSSVKQWKESWFWVTGNWQRVEDDPELDLDVRSVYGIANALPRCELSREIVDVLRSIYQAPPVTRRYQFILNRHRCLIELGLMTMDKEKHPRPALARLSKQKPRALTAGSEVRQKKVLEDMSRQCSASLEDVGHEYFRGGSFRGLPRIPDDVLRNVPFYPSMGAQAVKKYFTPKWEEFSSHGDLEDVLEASLAPAIRASAMQMKVLGEFRTRMQEQRWLSVAASKYDKEHKQSLEGLQASLDSARMAYEQLKADLKESDSNVLNLTKQLDNANAA